MALLADACEMETILDIHAMETPNIMKSIG